MSIMPRKKFEKITWCESRSDSWVANAAAIGTTPPEAAAFATKVEEARAAATAAEAARIAAKNATQNLDNAIEAMDIAAQAIIKQVRAKAEATGDPGVYALASLPEPATPSPVGAPGTATGFKVTLYQDGSMDITWKCPNPPGCTNVLYQVWRRVGGTGEFSYLGGTGKRRFLDTTIPAGATFFTYKIQGVRSTTVGPWATFNVFFGAENGGVMKATLEEPRFAA